MVIWLVITNQIDMSFSIKPFKSSSYESSSYEWQKKQLTSCGICRNDDCASSKFFHVQTSIYSFKLCYWCYKTLIQHYKVDTNPKDLYYRLNYEGFLIARTAKYTKSPCNMFINLESITKFLDIRQLILDNVIKKDEWCKLGVAIELLSKDPESHFSEIPIEVVHYIHNELKTLI
jgi:hypothetical protein